MATFSYDALGADGRSVRGELQAADERAAAGVLRSRSLFVLRLGQEEPSGARRRRRWRGLRSQALVFLLRELALMTRSGVTLLHALQVCANQRATAAAGSLADRLAERIRSGRSLSQALADERRVPPLARRLVESGEATGELDRALDRVAGVIERRATLRRNLVTSLAYPAIVFLVSIGVATFLVLGIVPEFVTFFMQRGQALPPTTQLLLDVSLWVRSFGVYVLGAAGVLGGVLLLAYATRRGRVLLDRAMLSIPIVGRLLQVGSFAQISWTLGALLRSGVSLLEAIRITAAAVGNRALGEHLRGTADRVLSGGTLSQGLDHSLVPPIVSSLVAAGEQSGAMTDVLAELARFYERDLQLRIRRMSSLIEPVLILIVGGMVGFVYLAFFQALMQLAR